MLLSRPFANDTLLPNPCHDPSCSEMRHAPIGPPPIFWENSWSEKAQAVQNPHKLEPIVATQIPVGSTYTRSIYVYNLRSWPTLAITEVRRGRFVGGRVCWWRQERRPLDPAKRRSLLALSPEENLVIVGLGSLYICSVWRCLCLEMI